jgi:hypothetical protein
MLVKNGTQKIKPHHRLANKTEHKKLAPNIKPVMRSIPPVRFPQAQTSTPVADPNVPSSIPPVTP